LSSERRATLTSGVFGEASARGRDSSYFGTLAGTGFDIAERLFLPLNL